MLYGPAQVIAVAGTNKPVRNEEEAVRRVRQTAAPGRKAPREKYTLRETWPLCGLPPSGADLQ